VSDTAITFSRSPTPSLLDLFCGAGGAAMGYHRAGFGRIVGVDIAPQKHYPFEFVQADALEYVAEHGREFDVIHASPPCQFGSVLTPAEQKAKHQNLIPVVRAALELTGKPYVIENVAGSRRHLRSPLKLCGSGFGLGVWRHRYFEISPPLAVLVSPCNHSGVPVLVSGTPRRKSNPTRREFSAQQCRDAMDVPWMTRTEMDDAIPPAYTEFIGKALLEAAECAQGSAE